MENFMKKVNLVLTDYMTFSRITMVHFEGIKVIYFKGLEQITALTSEERGAFITTVVCINVTDSFVPP